MDYLYSYLDFKSLRAILIRILAFDLPQMRSSSKSSLSPLLMLWLYLYVLLMYSWYFSSNKFSCIKSSVDIHSRNTWVVMFMREIGKFVCFFLLLIIYPFYLPFRVHRQSSISWLLLGVSPFISPLIICKLCSG